MQSTPFKRQLHTRHVVAVGCGLQNSPRHAYGEVDHFSGPSDEVMAIPRGVGVMVCYLQFIVSDFVLGSQLMSFLWPAHTRGQVP